MKFFLCGFGNEKRFLIWGLIVIIVNIFFSGSVYAATTSLSLGGVASQVIKSMGNVAKLITAISYIAGFGFAIGAILKFKAHKDNPTQIPVGTPFALLFIAAALIFLPQIFGIAGQTLFGSTIGTGGVSGVTTF